MSAQALRGALLLGSLVMSGACRHDAGRVYAVGDRRLFLDCSGARGPSVIFEAGAGRTSRDWQLVRQILGAGIRTCAYDRPGLGRSGPAGAPQDASADARQLLDLLARAQVPPPYVLVGHSYGALVVRVFAREFPRDTAGVVLVDSPIPDFYEAPAKAATGPIDWASTFAEVKAVTSLGDLPLVVITARQLPPGPSQDRERWWQAQAALARLSTRGSQRFADSDHMVPLHQPGVVADAVRAVVDSAERK